MRKRTCTFIFAGVCLSGAVFALDSYRLKYDRTLLLDAIERVESNHNPNAVGDQGRSLGSFQCMKAAWKDSSVPWPYSDVRNRTKSRIVCLRYCTKYAGSRATNEKMARTWNGGPCGSKKVATKNYWKKVSRAMNEIAKKKAPPQKKKK